MSILFFNKLFSAGKASTEMYITLHQQAMAFGNKKKDYGMEKLVDEMYNPTPSSISKTIQQNNSVQQKPYSLTDRDNKESTNGFNKDQPFGKAISRENFYQRFTQVFFFLLQFLYEKDLNQNIYEPKYHLIYKKSPLLEKQLSEREQDLNKKIQKLKRMESFNDTKQSNLTALCDYNIEIKKKICGPVQLDKQLPRLDIYTNKSLNEKRFNNLNLPAIFSKVAKTPTARINLQGRETYYKLHKVTHWPLNYSPNFDFVMKNNKLKIPNFDKNVKRKFILKPNYNLNELSGNVGYDESNSILSKKIKTPQFDKMTARETSIGGHSQSFITSFALPNNKINNVVSKNVSNILNNSLFQQ